MNTFKVRLLSVFMLAALLAAFPNSHAQAYSVIYVNYKAVGSNDGSSWANAYTDLQSALAASGAGAQIWVAQGTYTPTTGENRGLSFELRNGVALYGGFVGKETSLKERDPHANVTTLSGDIGKPGNLGDNSYHVIMGGKIDSTTILDGFTVTYGNANNSSVDSNFFGGGMYNLGKPTLANLIFRSNSATKGGGGMYNLGNPTLTSVTFNRNTAYDGGGMYNSFSSPILSSVTFSDNTAESGGGGMYNFSSSPMLSHIVFSSNSAYHGGGGLFNSSSHPTLTDVTFSNNSTTFFGGGMYNTASHPTLTDVTFSSNSSTGFGGGMYNYSSSSPTITTARFNKNFAEDAGGGMYNTSNSSPSLTDVTFSDNTTTGFGGGMLNEGATTLSDVTFSGNTASSGGGLSNAGSPSLTNVTFSSNSASDGGGMSSSGSPKLTNVTFSENSASKYGGGMLNSPAGTPTLTNVTFRGNTASDYGGGMYNDGKPILRNTILWGNTAPEGPQVFDNGSPCNPVTISDSVVEGDCPIGSVCKNIITADPLLGTLGDYGGRTQTIPLGPGSSAIDVGDDSNCPATDQRGVSRPQGKGCDIGAYEVMAEAVSAGTYDDTDPAWSYAGNWTTYSGSGPYNNTLHYTETVGDSAQLLFQGTQFTLIYTKASTRGSIGVYVDNVLVGTINAYSSSTLWQQTWTSPVFAMGDHTVRLVHAGGGTNIDVDAITILP